MFYGQVQYNATSLCIRYSYTDIACIGSLWFSVQYGFLRNVYGIYDVYGLVSVAVCSNTALICIYPRRLYDVRKIISSVRDISPLRVRGEYLRIPSETFYSLMTSIKTCLW
ncbi:hypothetical protein BZA77DRAFT_289112 [Pyronema omphalodes]|nr:hypothetical protein BZA77DRAFT_289112 [Pyronema omphalodes]